jgi:DNA-binding transcriptional LysR family regulator
MKDSRLAALDWEDIRVFAALARHRSLALTAKSLATSPAAVEKRLSRLEVLLGYPLFTRSAATFTLNRAGAEILAEAAQMEMAACSMLQKRPPGVP